MQPPGSATSLAHNLRLTRACQQPDAAQAHASSDGVGDGASHTHHQLERNQHEDTLAFACKVCVWGGWVGGGKEMRV